MSECRDHQIDVSVRRADRAQHERGIHAEPAHEEEQHRQQNSPRAATAGAGEDPAPAVEHLLQIRVHARRGEVSAEQETHGELFAFEQSHQLDIFGDLVSHCLMSADFLVCVFADQEELPVGQCCF